MAAFRPSYTFSSIFGGNLLGDGVGLLGDGGDLLGEGVDLLGHGGNLLGDGVDLLGDGGDLLDDGFLNASIKKVLIFAKISTYFCKNKYLFLAKISTSCHVDTQADNILGKG